MSHEEREQDQLMQLIGIMAGGIGYGELGAMLAARKLYREAAQSKKSEVMARNQSSFVPEPAPLSPEKLSMSIDEAARAIGITRRGVLACISSGSLKSFKIGNNQLILAEELRSWLHIQANGDTQ
ncbi:helix-turn-helix domain-containing protein [Pseudomonas sp. NPDC087346]|uniref:helix-turn-helix domain-containing protein n=1 Tax=Pseudomonas sp. NPDC087346 TaxID=3364438 RepID=UPI003825B5D7